MAETGVSVVIPVFSREGRREGAIRSALAQEGCDLEVVVVDDASPVPVVLSDSIAADPRVRLIRLETNGGPAAARNAGVRAASKAWIAFLDSDDRFLPGKLAAQLRLADPARPLHVVATGFDYDRGGVSEAKIPVEADEVATFCAGCWHCPGSTALIHREAFQIVGPLDERLRRLEDLDWFIRLGLHGGALRVAPEVLAWIDVGTNAAVEHVDAAARVMTSAYLESESGLRDMGARMNLAAYLELERSSARRKKLGWAASLPALLRSWLMRPRLTYHLARWWRPAAPR